MSDNKAAGMRLWHFLQSPCGIRVVFFLFAWLFLGAFNRGFLYKIQDFNLFIGHDAPFFSSLMQAPGGLLAYAGRYLTQFFFFPLPAAAVMAGLLVLVEWMTARTVRLGGALQALHFVPSMLLLLAQTSVGYFLYLDWEPSFPVVIVAGTLVALSAALLCDRLSGSRSAGLAAVIVLPVIVWLAAGSFVWLTLCCTAALFRRRMSLSQALLRTIPGLLPVAAAVCLAYSRSLSGMHAFLLSPLPHIGFLWPVCLVLLSGLTLIVLPGLPAGTEALSRKPWAPLVLAAAGCILVFMASFRDENFRTELRLQQLAGQQDWDAMVELAEQVKQPTRAISAYRAIALANSTRYSLADRFFDFNFDYKPVKCRLEIPEQMLYLADFELSASLPNSALRWCTEFSALYGYRPAMLRTMVMAALLNRELDLATKYLKILNQTTLHRIWALKTTHYLNDIHLLYNDPYYQHIIDRMPEEDTVEDFNGITYLFSYAGQDGDLYERSLITALYYKRIDAFCAKLKQMPADDAQHLPYHFQEAIAFAGLSVDASYLEQYPISPSVLDNVRHFQQQLNATDNFEDAKASLRKRFGHTLPYYMVFGEAADYDFPSIGTGSGLY